MVSPSFANTLSNLRKTLNSEFSSELSTENGIAYFTKSKYSLSEAARDACNRAPAANFRKTYALLHALMNRSDLKLKCFGKEVNEVDPHETKKTQREETRPRALLAFRTQDPAERSRAARLDEQLYERNRHARLTPPRRL